MTILLNANKYPFLIPYEKVKDKLKEQWVGIEALRQINLILDGGIFTPLPDAEASAKVFYLMIELNSALGVSDANNKFVKKLVEAFMKLLTKEDEDTLEEIARVMGINANLSYFRVPSGGIYSFSIDNKYHAELDREMIFPGNNELLYYKDKIYLTRTGLEKLIMAKVARKVCEMLYKNRGDRNVIEECVLDAKPK